jgi:hypothetical protein
MITITSSRKYQDFRPTPYPKTPALTMTSGAISIMKKKSMTIAWSHERKNLRGNNKPCATDEMKIARAQDNSGRGPHSRLTAAKVTTPTAIPALLSAVPSSKPIGVAKSHSSPRVTRI